MSSETCETCRWWQPPVDDYSAGMGLCQGIRERWEVCNSPFEHPAKDRSEYDDWDEVERLEQEALAKASACVVDGSGYYAALHTRPTFYCGEYKVKETSRG